MRRTPQGWALLLALCALLAVAGCRKKVDTSVKLLDPAGARVSFDGTWFACYDNSPSTDDGEILVVAGTVMSATVVDFTTTGGYCLTGETLRWTATFSMTGAGDQALNGWSDGSSVVSAPARQDGTGNLDNPPSATLINLETGTSDNGPGAPTVGSTQERAWFMDDTGSTARVYRDTNQPSPACDPPSGTSLGGGCLDATHYFIKVQSIPGITTQFAAGQPQVGGTAGTASLSRGEPTGR